MKKIAVSLIWFLFIILICTVIGIFVMPEKGISNVNSLELIKFSAFNGKILQEKETLGTTERIIPTETKNEGKNERYPTYGTGLSNITSEEKENLLAESSLLQASNSTFDSMDAEGNLFLNEVPTGGKLYKHTSSVEMYYGDVSNDEPAVIEKITVVPNEIRNYVTGLYAPAGEVVKIEISSDDLAAIGGELLVIVGQVSHRNNINNIWAGRDNFCRIPVIASKFTVKSTTAYVGSHLGGPIYIYPKNFDNKFSVTISGAVKYFHYIHGVTTKEEVLEMKKLSAPYYDFEVWDLGVRHSGPKRYASMDYDNLVKVGDLWEKICRTSRQVPCSANSTISVGYVYDPFVAAGEACAFQGGHSWINAPPYWMSSALNYETMTSSGFWGVIHEFNHLYQSYGLYTTKTNEVTNNATSLLSYSLYTNISAKRSENDSTLGGDWNRYTDPSRSLRETISLADKPDAQFALNTYADLIHTFGVDIFTKATRLQSALGVDGWYEALSIATGYNMTFYFEEMLHQTISDAIKQKYISEDRPIFVPVATVYQTGRSFLVGEQQQFSNTVKPFEIEKGETFTMNFNERLILPKNFGFKIKSVSQPLSGSVEKAAENIYKYIPGDAEYSGEFKVTIELLHETIKADDVTLVINLRQRIENKLNVTRYAYSSRVYKSVEAAIENNFEGYTSVSYSKSTSTFINRIANNHIAIVEGKIYIPEDGEYAFCLRSGRGNIELYLSVNNKNNLVRYLSLNSDHIDFAINGEHVVKLSLKAGDYVYFKEITLSRHSANDAYMEIGWANLSKQNPTSVTVPSSQLYNKNVDKKEYSFSSEPKYARVYTKSVTLSCADIKKQRIISVNHGCWGASKIENILDGNLDTFYHNNQNNFVSETNPFELVVDMGEQVKCNKIIITTRKTGQQNLPSTFKLYGGNSLEELNLLGEFVGLDIKNNAVEAYFGDADIRYYKLYVTDTKSSNGGNKYVTIAQIDFEYVFCGTEISPSELDYYITNKTSFSRVQSLSSFGYSIKGNGVVNLSFSGSGLMLFLNQDENCKFRLMIADNEWEIEAQSGQGLQNVFHVLNLNGETHSLKIEVLEGQISLDSLLIKP